MNMNDKSTFYLVREEILPEAIKKTIKVKEILKRGEVKTINEAVEKMGLSRSAYYKYKDYVFPFYEASKDKIITLSLLLEHKSGVLQHDHFHRNEQPHHRPGSAPGQAAHD